MFQFRIGQHDTFRFGDHHQLRPRFNLMLMQSENLPNTTFEAIPNIRLPNLFADGNTQLGWGVKRLYHGVNSETRSTAAFSLGINRLVFRPAGNPLGSGKPKPSHEFHFRYGTYLPVPGVSRFRPLRRRAFNTSRPPGVLMRFKNP